MNEKEDIFVKALEFEKKGYKLYKEAGDSSFNPFVKKIFLFLANEELNHIMAIEKYIKENDLSINFGFNKNEVKDFFNMTIDEFKEGIEFTENEIKVYEKALDLEKSGFDFYKTKANETNNNEIKDFLLFLVEQEKSHYLMLEKSLKFIKNPVNFFALQEDWSFEG
ncbi:MAG: ferritin-like domain-containing protein [Nanoarchaeota archaeon]